ncbi:MAG: hypothetical protein OXE46_15580 [Chloroflexi bacterium]|nr:hypothetical protein [Chloroflexota bacterium]
MAIDAYQPVVSLVKQAFDLARTLGIPNLLQPGLVKEMIIAEILGHEVIPEKRQPDARDPNDPSAMYEYLSCKEGGTGQLDRMVKSPENDRQDSLDRIRRNRAIFLAIFYEANQIRVKTIYKLETDIVLAEAIRKMDRSKNRISHVGFSERWAKANGFVVYSDQR